MGLFNHHSNDVNADGTVGKHHHTKADAALAGAAAHHESAAHPGRNGVLAAGTVGGIQHHRNHKHDHDGLNTTHHVGGTTAGGVGAGTGYGATHGGVAPTPVAGAGHVNTGPAPLAGVNGSAIPTEKEAHKLERKGKMESKMGGILGSTSMKEKSAAHLAQADHLRMQASELTEAQRLEHEAGLRRQRAVGLGADPSHSSGITGHHPRAI